MVETRKPTEKSRKETIAGVSKRTGIEQHKLKMDDYGDIYLKKWEFTMETEIDKARLKQQFPEEIVSKIFCTLNFKSATDKVEKLKNHAAEFKKAAAETQSLYNAIDLEIIPDLKTKMDQFYRDRSEMDRVRYDKDKCMRQYIRDTIDNKII